MHLRPEHSVLTSALLTLSLAMSLAETPQLSAEEHSNNCEVAPTLDSLESALNSAPERVMGFDATATEQDLRQLTRQLPCLQEPISASTLARLWYIRGIARLYAIDEQQSPDKAGPASVQKLFQIAHQVDGNLSWDSQNFGDFGAELWQQAVNEWDSSLANTAQNNDLEDGFWIPLESIPDIPGQLLLNGISIQGGKAPPTLHEGVHLLQQEVGSLWLGHWIQVSPGSASVHLPLTLPPAEPELNLRGVPSPDQGLAPPSEALPETAPETSVEVLSGEDPGQETSLASVEEPKTDQGAPEEPSSEDSHPTPEATEEAESPLGGDSETPLLAATADKVDGEANKTHPPESLETSPNKEAGDQPVAAYSPSPSNPIAPPDVEIQKRRVQDKGPQFGLVLAMHQLPQIYAGPELLLRYGLNEKFAISAGLGLSAGALLDCEACKPEEQLSYVIPLHLEALARLWTGPLEWNLGAGYQSYIGSNFGVVDGSSSTSAQQVQGTAAMIAGQGRTRFLVQLSSGYLFAPTTIQGLRTSLTVGIIRAGGRRP